MSVNQYCLACAKPVQFRCACCHTAGYCSPECQKRDWPLYHRHEQLVLAQPGAINLDASHRTQERQQRHRDVFTRRVRPVQRTKGGNRAKGTKRAFTKEEVEAELRRQGRAPVAPNVEQVEEIEVEEAAEEMLEEVVRNSMSPELQAFVDARRLLSEERDETLAQMRQAAAKRWGEENVSAAPSEGPSALFREPHELQREVEVAFLGQLEELRGRMREIGEEREVTPQHQTAIAHYLRMSELATLKHGVAT